MSMIFNVIKKVQIFRIRQNIFGKKGDYIMAITTTGRKTGKTYTTPIAYIQDGPHYVAFTRKAALSHWYKNARHAAEAMLMMKGESLAVYASEVLDEAERQRIFNLYKANPAVFRRLFRLPASATEADEQAALATCAFMLFTRIVP